MPAGTPILFFDAACRFCTLWKDAIAAGVWRTLRFEDANNRQAALQAGISDPDRLKQQMCLLFPDHTEAWGADAIVELLNMTSGGQGIAAALAGPLRQLNHRLYRHIAQSRPCHPTPREIAFPQEGA